VLLPLIVGFVTVIHVLQVRRRGVVPPFDRDPRDMVINLDETPS
jgi:hypothetical protein